MAIVAEQVDGTPTRMADAVDCVVGGDTHVDTIALCMCTPVGSVIDTITVDNDTDGHDEAMRWMLTNAPGPRLVVGLEGTRSYGMALTRVLQAHDITVFEVERPKRNERGRLGKSDPRDAQLAAEKLLRTPAAKTAQPRADGDREALRILNSGRTAMCQSYTRMINQLLALLLCGDAEDLRLRRAGDLTDSALKGLLRRRGGHGDPAEIAVRRRETQRLAKGIIAVRADLKTNLKQITQLVNKLAAPLLEQPGVGPVSAAQLLITYSHPGRCRNEAAFAALTGVSPVLASSGKVKDRHRLNRGGDRQANKALHVIAVNRMIYDERTRAFVERRSTDLNKPEIRRVLKRYIARELYKVLQRIHQNPTPATT